MVSTSPAPLRRKAAALSYSGDVTGDALLEGQNSITMNQWNLSGPSMIKTRPGPTPCHRISR
jgi:hypothetical protein